MSEHRQVKAIFLHAADLPQAEQEAFIKSECGGDERLLNEIRAMLREDAQADPLLDGGVGTIAHRMLAGPFPNPAVAAEMGPYRLRELLGEGGMGVVFLAEREDLGSLVAIKFLRDAWLSPARRERFESERRTLAQLNHPSIARLYDASTLSDGTPWFVMEYVDGATITEFCRRLSIDERLKLFRTVCEAVQYAHSHAIIHRDLKPSNILVKADGSVRLLDFGIAKQIDTMHTEDRTRTSLRMMTPAYASPEQQGGEGVGIQTDVYSLGVILYELLAGQLPDTPPEKPSEVADLDVLCLTAMHPDRQRRYRSVEALIRDVDHYLNCEPLEARPDTLGYRFGKFVSRNRRAVSAVSVALAAVIALVVFFTLRLDKARNAALAQAARAQRIQGFMLHLFDGGDPQAGPAESLRVTTLIDRGVQEARTLDAEPTVQADLYQTLGSMYQKLGKFDQADSLLRLGLERRRALYGVDSVQSADSESALGLLRADQAKLDEAEKLARESLDKVKRARPRDGAATARAMFALGKVLEARGQYDKAITVLDDAVKLQSIPGPPTAELAATLSELANNHFYAGHYDTAESLNQRILAIHRQLNGDRHPAIADDLINLGAIQFERGRYADAERYYRQALEITEGFYGKDHYETGSNLTMLGSALGHLQRYDEAAAALQRGLTIRERVYGPQSTKVAYNYNELGKIAQARGRLDEAEADYRRIVEIYRAAYHDHHYLIALAMANLADVYVDRKQYAEAEPLYREAIRRYTETLSAEHQYTGIARIRLGRALLRDNHYAEAEKETVAGLSILKKQSTPPATWVNNARSDLHTIYLALHEPEKAREFESDAR